VQGSLSFTQRTGLITLLYKKNDKLDTKNWHPISLLCSDYKILAKVLTNHLKSVIASVVSPSQIYGVPGCFSGESVRLLQDIINHSNGNDIGGALISLDQEKAFDHVEWSFLQHVLVKMNFGPSFRSWVQLLYSGIFSCVLVNGFTSEAFRVSRGVRQGCPLSPLLYILVAETFLVLLKRILILMVLFCLMVNALSFSNMPMTQVSWCIQIKPSSPCSPSLRHMRKLPVRNLTWARVMACYLVPGVLVWTCLFH
jgi:hypothetical protein